MAPRNPLERTGRWSPGEHFKFVSAIERYNKDWQKISSYIGTRNAAQVKSHAQKYYIALKKQEIEGRYRSWKSDVGVQVNLPFRRAKKEGKRSPSTAEGTPVLACALPVYYGDFDMDIDPSDVLNL